MAKSIPGLSGFSYGRIASGSLSNQAFGKFTDSNHLNTLLDRDPAPYDKALIDLYSQTYMWSNDFVDMLSQATPFNTDDTTFFWDVRLPEECNEIIDVPAYVYALSTIGEDGAEFEFTLKYKVAQNDRLSIGDLRFGPQVEVTQDPKPYNKGWLVRASLITTDPTLAIDKMWLSPGMTVVKLDNTVGEFDQKLSGLGPTGERLRMYETMGAGYGVEHTITGWADDKRFDGRTDRFGNAADMIVYTKGNKLGQETKIVAWEPFVESQLRQELLNMRVRRFIWGQKGYTRTNGGRQELKKTSTGVYPIMRNNGNYLPFNKGEFSINLVREALGDIFYGRTDVSKRHVIMYTNEAGYELFSAAAKEDALNSGLQLVANVGTIGSAPVNSGSAQNNLVYSFAFSSVYTRETGQIELKILDQLNEPMSNVGYGTGKRTPPVFMMFDVSDTTNGSLKNNVREVRLKQRPNMTYGYIDGRRHHLGAFASQGHTASSMVDGYTIFFEDKSDIFIEDPSKTFLMEEIPQIG